MQNSKAGEDNFTNFSFQIHNRSILSTNHLRVVSMNKRHLSVGYVYIHLISDSEGITALKILLLCSPLTL